MTLSSILLYLLMSGLCAWEGLEEAARPPQGGSKSAKGGSRPYPRLPPGGADETKKQNKLKVSQLWPQGCIKFSTVVGQPAQGGRYPVLGMTSAEQTRAVGEQHWEWRATHALA